MAEKFQKAKSGKADWFVQGILSKIGDIFDKLTGRGWQDTSSLATSELSEKLKQLLDSEVKDLGSKGKFVPHNIKLKMQWNKFSADSDDSMKKLEYELLTAAIDHINDHLYHTYQPLKIEVKPDYFTEGIKFFASFGKFDAEEREVEINVTVPQLNVQQLIPEPIQIVEEGEIVIADFTVGDKRKAVELKFAPGRRMAVGRTKENDLSIDDSSISKVHAALVLNSENQLMVADTGSTNGTFINGNRLAYGRAFVIEANDKVKFGTVEVFLRRVPKKVEFATQEQYEVEIPKTEAFHIPQPSVTNAQAPTENFQSGNSPLQPTLPQIVHPAIPKVPDPTIQSIPIEIPPIAIKDSPHKIPSDQPTIAAEDFVPQPVAGNTDYEVNLTEPRVKLNFDDEEKK